MGVDTNSGPVSINKKCNLESMGEVWVFKEAIANVLSLSDAADKFRVTLDTNTEKP